MLIQSAFFVHSEAYNFIDMKGEWDLVEITSEMPSWYELE